MTISRPFAVLCVFAALALNCPAASEAPPPVPSLAGTWRLLPQRSTDLGPWQTLDIVITIAGPRISIKDKLAAGSRAIDTLTVLDLSQDVDVVPIPWWTDNRHIGAYIGGDRAEHVHASWLDGGRILRTDADLVLDAQQGPRAVNILTDYKISPDGNELTVVQLRSTREIPIVYVCKRISP
jgi:hypothetical protein